ncbi:formylglycine-generating enzyme family protein [Desulfovibrio sulfodismutans]|uniref:Formylglycine-generating enzyme family protein n=1 Tax=Desulfolutivibrio sulfodismutans TaxID=63561 RepID=A0A7K3NL50_9BACT|nr:SUMF1/EgtB/PvdO family nonheme iron enzyme [Desulfolutivibrio sulfodismutans]NDY56924.1 formylglycine-generating enzyme family protein [Desulfolutivibrio sulfodismutans]
MPARLCLAVLAFLLLLPLPGHSGALTAKNQLVPQSGYNPQALPDDILLPMPCGLQMVFRTVEIPAQGLLWDRGLTLGCDNCDRPGMEYYDRRYPSSISGPFTRDDLPEAWQGLVPTSKDMNYQYYFIGKYEVSTLQWKAVMEGVCPQETIPEADAMPKTEISWFDAIDFSKRYTEWLLSNAPESLPHFKDDPKNIGYLRLPTEAEWEYAARGGNRVASETLHQEDFFPLEGNTTISDYAIYRSEGNARIYDKAQTIGIRKPNPLGLHDTSGNAAELVLDEFHFSVGGRLHGSAGGFLRKGGGFSSSEGEIKPGRREEIPYFSNHGATSTRDMGARLVLSGVNTPDGRRRQDLMEEWKQLGERGSVQITGDNPLSELDKLLEATADPQIKENLSRLRAIIKDNQAQLEKKDSENLEGLIRTSAYIIEALRSYAVRNSMAIKNIKDAKDEIEKLKAKGGNNGGMLKFQQESVEKYGEAKLKFLEAIAAILNFYRMKMEEMAKFDVESYKTNLNIVKSEYRSAGVGFMANMSQNVDVLEKHMEMMRSGRQTLLTKGKILDDVLVKPLRDDIPLK